MTTGHPQRLTRLLAIAAVAILSQAWVLALPYQQDDTLLLADPLGHFARLSAPDAFGAVPTHMRWTAWAWWALIEPLAGAPMRPWVHHLSSLLLHTATAVLLARLLAGLGRPRAGWLAGMVFALAPGGIQAVSWSAAASDLLSAPLLLSSGLLILTAEARPRGRQRTGAFLGAASLALLALLAKESNLLALPVLALLPRLARSVKADAEWPRVGALAGALGAYLFLRFQFFGELTFAYGAVSLPSPGAPMEWLALIPATLGSLAQAFYPWNGAVVFGDVPVLVGGALFGAAPPGVAAVALVFGLAPLLWLAILQRDMRRPLLAALVIALLLTLPAALLGTAPGVSAHARTLYVPLLALSALLGMGVRGLSASAIGKPATLALFLILLDGRAHVIETESLAARETVRLVAMASPSPDAQVPLITVGLAPRWGLGGIPTHNAASLHAALGPRFAESIPAGGRAIFVTAEGTEELRRIASRQENRPRDLRLLQRGPSAGKDVSPADRRAAQRLHPVGEDDPGIGPLVQAPWAPRGSSAWTPPRGLSLHASPTLAFPLSPFGAPDGIDGAFRWTTASGEVFTPFNLDARPGGTQFHISAPFELLLPGPLTGLAWEGTPPSLPTPSAALTLPAPRVLRPAPDATILLTPAAPPPTFRMVFHGTGVIPAQALLDLAFVPPRNRIFLTARIAVQPVLTRGTAGEQPQWTVDLQPSSLVPSGLAPGADPIPWQALLENAVLPELAARGISAGKIVWRVRFIHEGGLVGAECPESSFHYRIPE